MIKPGKQATLLPYKANRCQWRRYSYSKVIAIQPCDDISVSVRVMNNPARNVVKLGINATRNVVATVPIIDMQGRVIVTRTLQVKAGNDQYPIDLAGRNIRQLLPRLLE